MPSVSMYNAVPPDAAVRIAADSARFVLPEAGGPYTCVTTPRSRPPPSNASTDAHPV